MLRQHDSSFLPTARQGEQIMSKRKAILIAIITVSITLMGVLLIMRKSLCEIHIRSGQTEISAFMAYEPME